MSVPSCQLNADAKYVCRTVQSNFHMSNIFQKFLFLYCIDVYLKKWFVKKKQKKSKKHNDKTKKGQKNKQTNKKKGGKIRQACT